MDEVAGSAAAKMALDWNQLRAFVAVVEAGSLTAAARLLATSQPTLSRQIADLEATLGMALFERVARGLRLTAAGESLLPAARQMQAAARAASLAALGQSQDLRGTVRLTASEMTSAFILPDVLRPLRQAHPEIQIELVASNRMENLLDRQADIAIRHARPTQTALMAQCLGETPVGAYAHADYLARFGGEVDLQRAGDYDWIGLDTSDMLLRGFREAGFPVVREFFALRCDNMIVGWQMALAGLGIALAPAVVAARWPRMQAVLPAERIPKLPVWLTAHRELRQSARIRVVFDTLAAGLRSALIEMPS